MKMMGYAFVLCSIAAVAYGGTSKATRENYDRIEIGMTKEQVIQTVGGYPNSMSKDIVQGVGKQELWMYFSEGSESVAKPKGIRIYFSGDKVFSKDWVE